MPRIFGHARIEGDDTPLIPDEVPMHKVHKAMVLTPWPGFDSLYAATLNAFTQLPSPSDKLAEIEFFQAANLVRLGATTTAVKGLLGMTDEQRDDLILFAQSLP